MIATAMLTQYNDLEQSAVVPTSATSTGAVVLWLLSVKIDVVRLRHARIHLGVSSFQRWFCPPWGRTIFLVSQICSGRSNRSECQKKNVNKGMSKKLYWNYHNYHGKSSGESFGCEPLSRISARTRIPSSKEGLPVSLNTQPLVGWLCAWSCRHFSTVIIDHCDGCWRPVHVCS